MNAERLHATAIALSAEMKKRQVVEKMQEMINALSRVVNQPHASYQQELSQSLKDFYSAISDTPSDHFSPAWRQTLEEIGGEGLFGGDLKQTVELILAGNQITPAVALEELQQLHSRAETFKDALKQCTESLEQFNVGAETLAPGECEIGILIPRKAVSNELLSLVSELKEISFILNTFSEISTGKKDPLTVRSMSSSDLLVHLQAAAPYAACVALAIERIVALYKQLLEIRKLRQEIQHQGVPDQETAGIEKFANELMEKGIEKVVTEVLEKYHKKSDKGRKNELANSLRISLNKIANRIDKGFNIEVRVEPIAATEEAAENKELENAIAVIQSAVSNMQYLKLEGQPILRLPEKKDDPKKKE
jgi:hypothetical protein